MYRVVSLLYKNGKWIDINNITISQLPACLSSRNMDVLLISTTRHPGTSTISNNKMVTIYDLEMEGFFKKKLFLKKFFFKLIYFCPHWVFVAAPCLSLVVASGGCFLVVVCGFLRAVGCLAVEHWLMGSVAVVQGLSCPVAHGIFPDQGSNLCPLH